MQTQDIPSQVQPQGQFTLRRAKSMMGGTTQTVLVLRDASGSMRGRKAEEAGAATVALVSELALPVNRGGFHVGVIDFASGAAWVHPLSPAAELNGHIRPMRAGGNTNITAALTLAVEALQKVDDQNMAAAVELRPVVITLSDGHANAGGSPETVAAEIRRFADHVTVGFGSGYDEQLLLAMATSPQHHYRIKDSGSELRMFLATVGRTLTKTLTHRSTATLALGQVGQP